MFNQLRSRASPAKQSSSESSPEPEKSATKQRQWLKLLLICACIAGGCWAFLALSGRKNASYQPELHPVEVLQSEMDRLSESPVRKRDCRCLMQKRKRGLRQVFVMGMHHSGTSPLTMLLTKMGFNAGPRRGLLLKSDNPLKYWEHKATVVRNQQFINAYFRMHGVMNKRQYNWVGWGFDLQDSKPEAQLKDFKKDAAEIITSMNNLPVTKGEPWVMKDPRLSITGRAWLEHAPDAVCVILLRDPVESAFRFLGYNELPGNYFNVREWGLVWEEYTARAIANCKATNTPIVFVSYRQFCVDPTAAISQLYDDLTDVGVDMRLIKKLSNIDVTHYLGARWKALHKEKFGLVDPYLRRINRFKFLSPRAINLWEAITDDVGVSAACLNCLDVDTLQDTAWATEDVENLVATEAYAIFVDEVTEAALQRTKVLAASILQFDSSRDLVAVVRRYSISEKNKQLLKQQGWMVYYIDEFGEWSGCIDFESGEETDAQVPELFYTKLQDVPPSTDEKSAQKNSIQLLNYRVVAFMSPDFLVVSSPDKWFETQEIIASAAGGTLTIVNYNLLKQAGPLKTIKRCQPQWQTPFSRAISASIANVCELDAGVAIMDPHYAAVYWEKVEPSMISTLIRKKACHAPWVIADPSAELSLEEENNVYVDNWLFLDAIVGRTTDLKESKK